MSNRQDDLKPEYSPELIQSGARGKYAQQYKEGTNVVVIDPDLARAFPTAKAVNDALRKYLAEHSSST
jgi:hypothetical protein